jgi:MFS family permease
MRSIGAIAAPAERAAAAGLVGHRTRPPSAPRTAARQNVQGFSPVETGVRTLPPSLTLMVTAPLSGFLTERFGPRPAMVVGLHASMIVAAAVAAVGAVLALASAPLSRPLARQGRCHG